MNDTRDIQQPTLGRVPEHVEARAQWSEFVRRMSRWSVDREATS